MEWLMLTASNGLCEESRGKELVQPPIRQRLGELEPGPFIDRCFENQPGRTSTVWLRGCGH